MHALCTLTFMVLLTLVTTTAQAEGLIHQLPEDGAWAQFDIQGKGTDADGSTVTLSGTITMSSVGTAEVDGEQCRWIEVATEGKRDDQAFTDIVKLLIPESQLAQGKDPLKHVLKIWHKHSQVPGGAKQIEDLAGQNARYLRKFRPLLHGPFEMVQKLEKAPVDSKLGKVDCDGYSASGEVEMGTILMNSQYTIRLHKSAPFGVVTWQAETEVSREGQALGTMSTKFKLSDFGKDAKSAIPDAK
ncbi:hypothetical protein Mal52_03410 [Symmachiella dynata]|uniref:YceI-like domain protein n=1 Tax=Symmachiella dynata TaxID=2527995 RepID=A0A517ZHD1_9PLAN|nr:hypothetical protein [Symmachiella dynata]QDU41886.1 hypothetical protein Mal52_03410 [Symmachiella dynata]